MLSRYFCTLILIVSSPLASTAAPGDTQPVTADELFDRERVSNFTISDDGKYLAFVTSRTTDYIIGVTDIDASEVIHQFSVGKNYPGNLRWVGNRQLMFNHRGRLLIVNRDGGDLRVLLGYLYDPDEVKGYVSLNRNLRAWHVVNELNEDPEHILLQAYDRHGEAYIHKFNVFTGEKEDLYDGDEYDVDYWVTNLAGDVSLARKNDDEEYSFYTLNVEEEKLEPFKLGFEGHNFDLDFDGRTYLGKRVHLVGFSYDNSHVYITENLTTGRFRLLELSLDDQTYKVILEDDVYDVGTPDDPPEVIFDFNKKELIGVRYDADKLKTVWFSDKLAQYQRDLDEQYPDEINKITEWSDGFKRLLVRSFSDKSRGKVYIYDPTIKRVSIQTQFSPDIKESQLGDRKVVEYRTRDGYPVEAYLTLPPSREAKNLPTLILPHGGPFSRDHFEFDPYAQYFASRGYAVLSPNYRGSTGYGREHLMAGKTELDNLMVDDIVDGAMWLISEGISDKERMHIAGFSYGGYAALMSVIRYPTLFTSAASYGAVLDIRDQIKHYKKQDSYFAYEFWKEMVAGPDDSRKRLRSISPTYLTDKITVPVMVMHGKEDSVVPMEQVEDFEEEAEDNKNVTVVVMKDESHSFRNSRSRIYFTEKVFRFFEKNDESVTQSADEHRDADS